jgi:hypothetical protein
MPTRKGDVVITQVGVGPIRQFGVWSALRDGEQLPDPAIDVSYAMGQESAMMLARMMTAEHGGGAIYLLDLSTLTWRKLYD